MSMNEARALDSWWTFLKHNAYVQACVTVFTILLATRVLSSHRFKQARFSTAPNQAPPTIPYWVPYLRHAFSMAWDTKRFAARCLQKYGDGNPFFIDAAGRKILLLLDPTQIKRVMNASKELDPNPFIHDMILGQMLGSPKETIDFYRNDHGKMDHVQMAHIRQHVTGSGLDLMTSRLYERLRSNISKEVSQDVDGEGWMQIADLFTFVQNHVTLALTETFMGTDISEQYPEMTTDQWTFMDRSIEIVMGLPSSIISGAYDARDRLLANIKRWNTESEALRVQGRADTTWDPNAGSGLLQERQELFAKTPGFNEDARISQVLGLLFAANGLTPPVTFWYLFEILKSTSLLQSTISLLHTNFDPLTRTYDFATLTFNPLLQSIHAETARLYASNVAVRVVTTPSFALDNKYTVEKDTTLFIYTKYTSLFAPGWSTASAHTTSQPLDTFWPQRFLDTKGKYSEAGLSGCWTSYGGGEHKCPGRLYARNAGIVALAVLLGEMECEAQGGLGGGRDLDVRETAFGKMVPGERVGGRVRLRPGRGRVK